MCKTYKHLWLSANKRGFVSFVNFLENTIKENSFRFFWYNKGEQFMVRRGQRKYYRTNMIFLLNVFFFCCLKVQYVVGLEPWTFLRDYFRGVFRPQCAKSNSINVFFSKCEIGVPECSCKKKIVNSTLRVHLALRMGHQFHHQTSFQSRVSCAVMKPLCCP